MLNNKLHRLFPVSFAFIPFCAASRIFMALFSFFSLIHFLINMIYTFA